MAEQKFILREKCLEMMDYAYDAMKDMPKDHRYTLGGEIIKSMGTLLRLIIRCGKKYYKKTTLEEMDIEHDALEGHFQVAFMRKAITPKEYEVISRHLKELGRMIGGWIKKAPR